MEFLQLLALALVVAVFVFAVLFAHLRSLISALAKRLDNHADSGKALERKVADIGNSHLMTKERVGEQISDLHARLSAFEAPVARTAVGEAAFIPDMGRRTHNEWSLLLSDLITQAEVCGFELTVNFSVPVEQ